MPFAALTLGLTFLVVFQGWRSYQAETQYVERHAESLNYVLAQELLKTFDGIDRSIKFLASQIKPESLEPSANPRYESEVVDLLTYQVKLNPLIGSIRVFDSTGMPRYGLTPTSVDVTVADREYFQQSKQYPEAVHYSTLTVAARYSPFVALPIAKAILSKEGKFMGSIVILIPVTSLQSEFKKIAPGPNAAIAIRTIEDGTLIYRFPEIPGPINSKVRNSPTHLAVNERESGTLLSRTMTDGLTRVFAFQRLSPYPYYINIGIAQQDYLVRWRSSMTFSAVGAILLDLLIGFFFFRQRRAYALLDQSHQETVAERNRYQILMESSLDGIHILRLDGTVYDANTAFCDQLGYTREEVLTFGITQWNAQLSAQQVQSLLDEFSQDRWTRRIETVYRRKDGSLMDADVSISPVTIDGQLYIYAASRDITERKQINAELRRSKDEALRALKAKSEFMGMMSHELRTPLNAIIGFSELLQHKMFGELNDKQSEYVADIHVSGKHLLMLINRILDVVELEAGRVALSNAPFKLEEVMSDVTAIFKLAAEKKGLDLVLAVAPDIPQKLVGDRRSLRQILNNLVDNAIKFSAQGKVELKVYMESQTSSHAMLNFSVKDNGIGFDVADYSKISQSFTQADNSITRRFGGTGLGLTTTNDFLALMGSELKIESQPGKGATFSFTVEFALDLN
ncbi:MAG: ATP-binding protein [Alcaligenaceae bacterium]